MEFKLEETAEDAITQIKSRQYTAAYKNSLFLLPFQIASSTLFWNSYYIFLYLTQNSINKQMYLFKSPITLLSDAS